MTKFQVVLSALVVVFAFSAISVSTAPAETTLLAEWLIGGNEIETTHAVKSTGTVLLTDTGTLFGSLTVSCADDTYHGIIGPMGTGEITSVLNSSGKSIEVTLKGEAFLCEGTKTCEKDATETEEWPLKLPFLILVFLLEAGNFTLLFYTPGAPGIGFELKCLLLGSLIEDTCSAEGILGTLINNSLKTGVEETGHTEPGESCTEGSPTSGFVEADPGNLISLETGTEKLTVSSEGAGE
jgi:hypothetical protein